VAYHGVFGKWAFAGAETGLVGAFAKRVGNDLAQPGALLSTSVASVRPAGDQDIDRWR
jgi:hypothetical protein